MFSLQTKMEILLLIGLITTICHLQVSGLPLDTENPKSDEEDLVLLHAIFRHGDRTNDPSSEYPKDPYINETYFPFGLGQLTNKGKQREYELGQFLRSTYNEFLGSLYFPDLLDARSTDVNRTKMSLELVLAALFPPVAQTKWALFLNWQPIPYNYVDARDDKLLYGFMCPNYAKYFGEYLMSDQMQIFYKDNQDIFAYLSENTGLDVTSLLPAFQIYWALRSESEWGFQLPEWTEKIVKFNESITGAIYPDILNIYALKMYEALAATDELKTITAGAFLQKVVQDTQAKIDGTLSPEGRKIFLYSAHDINIAAVLAALGVYKLHVPPYGSCILFEIQMKDGQYGIKIFYRVDDLITPALIKLPECEEFCPWNQFVSIVAKYFPKDNACGTVECPKLENYNQFFW